MLNCQTTSGSDDSEFNIDADSHVHQLTDVHVPGDQPVDWPPG